MKFDSAGKWFAECSEKLGPVHKKESEAENENGSTNFPLRRHFWRPFGQLGFELDTSGRR